MQGHSQKFLKGFPKQVLSYIKQGFGPLSNWKYFNCSKLTRLLYISCKIIIAMNVMYSIIGKCHMHSHKAFGA